jgi:hypothetical protein
LAADFVAGLAVALLAGLAALAGEALAAVRWVAALAGAALAAAGLVAVGAVAFAARGVRGAALRALARGVEVVWEVLVRGFLERGVGTWAGAFSSAVATGGSIFP